MRLIQTSLDQRGLKVGIDLVLKHLQLPGSLKISHACGKVSVAHENTTLKATKIQNANLSRIGN